MGGRKHKYNKSRQWSVLLGGGGDSASSGVYYWREREIPLIGNEHSQEGPTGPDAGCTECITDPYNNWGECQGRAKFPKFSRDIRLGHGGKEGNVQCTTSQQGLLTERKIRRKA